MKTLIAILVLAMVACAFAQYNYGYSSYTPNARVSHYASSGYGYGVPHYGYGASYYGGAAAYPYRVY